MIRNAIAIVFLSIGVLAFIIAVIGNYKFTDQLKRMHAAGICDSFGFTCFAIGCIIINGFAIISAKILIAMVILYFTSPVASHMLSKLEAETNKNLDKISEVQK